MESTKWIEWANELRNIALEGLYFSKDEILKQYYNNIKNISFNILNEYSNHKLEDIELFFSKDIGIQTPKLDSRGAVFKNGKILLVKERNNLWTLPGGWVEPYLSVEENIVKEIKEEAGLNVKPIKIIAVQDRKKHNNPIYIYNLTRFFILCELIDGEFIENDETIESDYFHINDLPELMTSKTNYKQIELCFDAYNNNDFVMEWD